MSAEAKTRLVTVINEQGLHARPAFKFVEVASRFQAKITIVKGAEEVSGRSILDILTLGAGPGTQLFLRAAGEDADAALDTLAELFATGFSE